MSAAQDHRPRTLLLIDDEPSVTTVLKRVFSQDVVHICADGASALDMLAQIEPDVIVCDLGLPQIDGPSLYQLLLLEYPDMVDRIIFISGGACSMAHAGFLSKGHRPHLQKPFSLAQIRTLVDDVAGNLRLVS